MQNTRQVSIEYFIVPDQEHEIYVVGEREDPSSARPALLDNSSHDDAGAIDERDVASNDDASTVNDGYMA